jgi:hypothetical protein
MIVANPQEQQQSRGIGDRGERGLCAWPPPAA